MIDNPGKRSSMVELRDYVDQRIADINRHYDTRLEAVQHATNIALEANEKRLDGMNEFRDTLRDQAGRFITRDEVGLMINKLEVDVRSLQKTRDMLEGKASQASVASAQITAWAGIVIGIISLLVTVAKLVIK